MSVELVVTRKKVRTVSFWFKHCFKSSTKTAVLGVPVPVHFHGFRTKIFVTPLHISKVMVHGFYFFITL